MQVSSTPYSIQAVPDLLDPINSLMQLPWRICLPAPAGGDNGTHHDMKGQCQLSGS